MSPAKRLMIIIICAFPFLGNAQINLVYNGSFEDIKQCPNSNDEIKYANYWGTLDTLWDIDTSIVLPGPWGNPDLFNTCGVYPYASLPVNINFFHHYPRTGNSLVQIRVYNDERDSTVLLIRRDYLQGRLRKQLIGGKLYCLTFYVSFDQGSRYATNHIGAYLDDGTIDTVASSRSGLVQSMYTPQVYDTAIITDTLNWHKVQGTFSAEGNEKFITIGNFFDNVHTDTIRMNIQSMFSIMWGGGGIGSGLNCGFLVIDDVSVIAVDAVANAGRDTSISTEMSDSAWIGNHDGYVPCRWYNMSGVLIDSNKGGFMVKPTVTTSYIMELEVCGHITRDTVKITVTPLSIVNGKLLMVNVRVYPNPVIDELTIEGAAGSNVVFYDVVGREVMNSRSQDQKSVVDISALAGGVYFVKITDPVTGESITRKLIKE